jgi:hypothetical protein
MAGLSNGVKGNPRQRIEGKREIAAWGISVDVARKAGHEVLLMLLNGGDIRVKDLFGIGGKGSLVRHAFRQLLEGFQRMKLKPLVGDIAGIHGDEDSLRPTQPLASQDNFLWMEFTGFSKGLEVKAVPLAPGRDGCF